MKTIIPGLLAAGLLAFPLSAGAQGQPGQAQQNSQAQERAAEGTPEIDILTIDVVGVARGYRASEVIGGAIYNEGGDKVGSVDDLIVRTDDKVVYAILSVGGFLGIGDRLIAVPYDALGVAQVKGEDRIILPGATKEQLKKAPEFQYGSDREKGENRKKG